MSSIQRDRVLVSVDYRRGLKQSLTAAREAILQKMGITEFDANDSDFTDERFWPRNRDGVSETWMGLEPYMVRESGREAATRLQNTPGITLVGTPELLAFLTLCPERLLQYGDGIFALAEESRWTNHHCDPARNIFVPRFWAEDSYAGIGLCGFDATDGRDEPRAAILVAYTPTPS